MKTIPILEKESPKPSKPSPKPLVIQKVERVFHIRSLPRKARYGIGFLGLWSVTFASFLLAYGEQVNLHEVFFYFIFLILCILATLMIGSEEAEQVQEDATLRISRFIPAICVWGPSIFLFMLTIFMVTGARLSFPNTYSILRQMLIVVPAETAIFIIFLPPVLDAGIFNRIPWIPGWVAAQGIFGLMHVVSGAMTPIMGFFAGLMGILWYIMYSAGRMKKHGQYFGLGSVLAFHFVWNVMAESASEITADPLVTIFKMMGL
jgi:hypothetical protein